MTHEPQLAALGAAIGRVDCYTGRSTATIYAANDNYPRVVALTGAAGSGKSTAADYLIRQHGYERVKFAGPLKRMAAAIGLDNAALEGELKEAPLDLLCGKTPRHVMQTLGTEWGRGCIGEDLWVRLWLRDASVRLFSSRVVVDDLRFPNEAAAVRSLGGVIIKLAGRGGIAGTHESEAGCGQADAIVDNDGCVTELYAGVEEAVRRAA